MTTGPDRWTRVRKLARQLYDDHRNGNLQGAAGDVVGSTRAERRRSAFVIAAAAVYGDEPPGAVDAAAERFGLARR